MTIDTPRMTYHVGWAIVTVRVLLLLVGLANFLGAFVPSAEAQNCSGTGDSAAKVLEFPASDSHSREGLAASYRLALSPGSEPEHYLRQQTVRCKRTEFNVGMVGFALFGSDSSAVLRYALHDSDYTRIAFLALGPRPEAAAAAISANSNGGYYTFKKSDMIYMLGVTAGEDRLVFRYYDAIPTDAVLTMDMCRALSGEDPVIGVYDSTRQQSRFDITQSNPHVGCAVS